MTISWHHEAPGRVVEVKHGHRLQIVFRQGRWRLEQGHWLPGIFYYQPKKAIASFQTLQAAKEHAERLHGT